MSYWAGEAIAHTIVSFGFDDGAWLAFSIETRKQRDEVYSSIAGFFKQYELAVVAADERDVVRVRSNIRGEDVRIYRLRMTPANARILLGEYVVDRQRTRTQAAILQHIDRATAPRWCLTWFASSIPACPWIPASSCPGTCPTMPTISGPPIRVYRSRRFATSPGSTTGPRGPTPPPISQHAFEREFRQLLERRDAVFGPGTVERPCRR